MFYAELCRKIETNDIRNRKILKITTGRFFNETDGSGKLLADMSLKEKVDQMLQLSGAFYLGDENSVLTGPANDMGIGKEDLEMAGSILGSRCRYDEKTAG